jgi:hypothetical protein
MAVFSCKWISCLMLDIMYQLVFFIIVIQVCLVNFHIRRVCSLLSYLAVFSFYAWLILVKWYKYWVTLIDVGIVFTTPLWPFSSLPYSTLLPLYCYCSCKTDSSEIWKPHCLILWPVFFSSIVEAVAASGISLAS